MPHPFRRACRARHAGPIVLRAAVLRAAAGLAVLLLASPALGQSFASREATEAEAPAAAIHEEIVVSARLDAAPRRAVGASVTVIDREEIERRHAVTVADLLRTVPGLEVSATGGPGGPVSVFLRGAGSSHTLVLLDGVRLNAATTGAVDFSDLTLDGIERVEVLRGPQSALYGSEALGGVVSLFTRTAAGRQGGAGPAPGVRGTLTAETGSHDLGRLATSLAGAGGRWDWWLAASHHATDGVSRASESLGNRETDPWENTTVAAGAAAELSGGGRADLSLRWLEGDTGLDAFLFGVGPVDDPNYRQQRRGRQAALAVVQPVTGRWTQHLRVGVADETLSTLDPDPEPAFHDSRFDTTVTDLDLRADLALLGGGAFSDTLSVGFAAERREGGQPGAFGEQADLQSVYFENRVDWRDRLHVTVGARHDDHSVFGGETTWRGTAAWRGAPDTPLGHTRLHGSWGTGFKAPTLVDLYYPFYGNPELRPETSESWDLGWEQTFAGGRAVADLTAFASDFEDLINFDLATFLAGNVARARVEGYEASLAWHGGAAWSARASYTRTDSEDLATGELLPRRPRHRGAVTVLFAPLPRWSGSLSAVVVRERIDSDGRPLDDYERLDASLEHRLGERWRPFLRVDNLLGARYEEVAGFTSPGRTARLGVRFRF
ncbi:MAG TPA: TonB-dependent receptor [Thermoanaerobaculia bacterium]|nr:TonB-dependent receptor [Thermoanaerobaculia bacterium]